MRFSLQRLLIYLLITNALIALDVSLAGNFSPWQALYVAVMVLIVPLPFEYFCYRIYNPSAKRTLKPAAIGIVAWILVSVMLCDINRVGSTEVCSRSYVSRRTANYGAFRWTREAENEFSRFLRDEMKYVPTERNWTYYTRRTWFDVLTNPRVSSPRHRFPLMYVREPAQEALREFTLVELKDILELDGVFDICFKASARYTVFKDIPLNFYDERQNVSIDQVKREWRTWYERYEPLLHPLHSVEDVQKMLLRYRQSQQWDPVLDKEIVNDMQHYNIPIPANAPIQVPPIVKP